MTRLFVLLCLLFALSMPAFAAPTVQEQVDVLAQEMANQFTGVAQKHHLPLLQVWILSEGLDRKDWYTVATRAGLSPSKAKALREDLLLLPHKNFGELTPYNLMVPAKDKWGYTAKEGIRGWEKYRPLIEQAAIEVGIDPMILGAYIWTESNFNTNQDNRAGGLMAIGLGSVQAQYHPELGSLESRVRRLKDDPLLNLRLTAREFRGVWNSEDMFGTVMDVWYPAWRRRRSIPHLKNAYGYMQLFSNRYFMLIQIMGG